MKKYLLSSIALVLAIAFTAFQLAPSQKSLGRVTVYFTGNPLDDDQVADPSFWKLSQDPIECDGIDQACSFEIDDTYLDGDEVSGDVEIDIDGDPLTGFVPTGAHDGSGNITITPILNKDAPQN